MMWCQLFVVEKEFTLVRSGNLIDNSYQGCFACTIRAQQTEYALFGNIDTYAGESGMVCIPFRDIFC